LGTIRDSPKNFSQSIKELYRKLFFIVSPRIVNFMRVCMSSESD